MGYPHRIKPEGETWYHLYASTAAKGGEYPLEPDWVREKFRQTVMFYTRAYRLEIGAFCIMGNHFHLVVRVEAQRELSREELMSYALKMYPKSRRMIEAWTDEKWARFAKRIGDVSEFMRSVMSHFAKWYNRMNNRKGRFWAERFKSTLLLSPEAVRDCALYVELNPVRANLVERPEEYRWSSLYLREIDADRELLPLSAILGERGPNIYEAYKGMLYHRGAVPTKLGQKPLDEKLLVAEEKRGFKRRGVYRKKLRYFTDGLIVGSELKVREQLLNLRELGKYLRRQHPISQSIDHAEATHFSLREQREHFIELAT